MSCSEAARPRKAARYNFSTPFKFESWGKTRSIRSPDTVSTPEPPPPSPPPTSLKFVIRRLKVEPGPHASEEHRNFADGKEVKQKGHPPRQEIHGNLRRKRRTPPPPNLWFVIRRPKVEPGPHASEEHRNFAGGKEVKQKGHPPRQEIHRNLRRKRTTLEVRDPTEIAGPSSRYMGSKSKEAKYKVSIWLTKEQIQADYYALTLSKPPRTSRRSKSFQEKIYRFFPGLSLPSVDTLSRCGSLS